ncbi:MAG: RibD family protein [Vicinamibacterales bacterium]
MGPLATPGATGAATAAAWRLVREAAGRARALDDAGERREFGVDAEGGLLPAWAGSPAPALTWIPGHGWCSGLAADDARAEIVDLYLPMCSATPARPIVLGHLGQSLDGFIATHTGDSQFVTGAGNLVHMHRLRALADAVLVGAGTVVADDPRLTTRLVDGDNPVRVVYDPRRRLDGHARVFADGVAPTLYVCERTRLAPGETRVGCAEVVPVEAGADGSCAAAALTALRARGLHRLFIEGGGVTVSAFLEAGLLDRLQMAVAPLLIGEGRPAVRLAPLARLSDCRRPACRVYRMGGDVLFDCDLRTPAPAEGSEPAADAPVTRVI